MVRSRLWRSAPRRQVPITSARLDADILHTILSGRVTDGELFAYYRDLPEDTFAGTWRELVDGREIAEMAITPAGQMQLASLAEVQIARLRGGMVAMVATRDSVYGMFRMWEMQREGLGYAVRVFRAFDEAIAWLSHGAARKG